MEIPKGIPFTQVLEILGYTLCSDRIPYCHERTILKDGETVFRGNVFEVRNWLCDRGELPDHWRPSKR